LSIKDYLETKHYHKLKKKYPNWNYENWCEDLEFIWGIKSGDDLTNQPASMYTMNDLDICYDHINQEFTLGIETIYWFTTLEAEIKYLDGLLSKFTEFMERNSLKTTLIPLLRLEIVTNAQTIEELYVNFKMFVNGRKSLMEVK
jgi:hypothetical protein